MNILSKSYKSKLRILIFNVALFQQIIFSKLIHKFKNTIFVQEKMLCLLAQLFTNNIYRIVL